MLCKFLLYSKVTRVYIYIFFFIFFSIIVYHRTLNIVPCYSMYFKTILWQFKITATDSLILLLLRDGSSPCTPQSGQVWLSKVEVILCDFWAQIVKLYVAFALFSGIVTIGALSCHVNSMITMRPLQCEETQSTWRSHVWVLQSIGPVESCLCHCSLDMWMKKKKNSHSSDHQLFKSSHLTPWTSWSRVKLSLKYLSKFLSYRTLEISKMVIVSCHCVLEWFVT